MTIKTKQPDPTNPLSGDTYSCLGSGKLVIGSISSLPLNSYNNFHITTITYFINGVKCDCKYEDFSYLIKSLSLQTS